MSNIEVEDIFKLSKELGGVQFKDIVKASCEYEMIPIDLNVPEDRELIKNLNFALNNFIKLTERSGQRFTGRRINDVGKKLENLIVEEMKKMPLEVNKLGASGYPDFEIKQNMRTSYLEIKTTGNIQKDKTHHRMFYYSSGKKLKADARHLLLQIQMEEETSRYWKVVSWELRDLSTLTVRLKTEFNAGFHDFARTVCLSSSNLGIAK